MVSVSDSKRDSTEHVLWKTPLPDSTFDQRRGLGDLLSIKPELPGRPVSGRTVEDEKGLMQ